MQSSGKSAAQVARDLGISDNSLYNWQKQLAEKGADAFPGTGHQSALEEENRRLKRELEVTRQERDILKKWSASSHGNSDEISIYRAIQAGFSRGGHVSGVGCL